VADGTEGQEQGYDNQDDRQSEYAVLVESAG
jgi:hypothetical protein